MAEKNKEVKILNDANKIYGEYYESHREKVEELLDYLSQHFSTIVIWGAGLKGKSFLYHFDSNAHSIDCVIDMDVEKEGTELFTGHKVHGIQSLNEDNIIIVINDNYYPSICFSLIDNGFDIKEMKIICIDHFIDGIFDINDVKESKIWERKRYYD
jgi:hypothetical protein